MLENKCQLFYCRGKGVYIYVQVKIVSIVLLPTQDENGFNSFNVKVIVFRTF